MTPMVPQPGRPGGRRRAGRREGGVPWVALFGAVSFEVFGEYGPDTFSDPAATFDVLVDLTAGVLGLTQAGPAARGGSAS